MNITINAPVIAAIFVVALALNGLRNHLSIGLDDSDQDGRHRSNLKVATDYKTGLQYLIAPGGGVTPRLDVDGNQMRKGM